MFFVSGLRQNPCIPNQPMYYIMRKWICQGKLFNIGAQAPHRIYPPSWRKVAFAAGKRRREIVEFFSHFLQAGGRETVVGGDDSAPRYSSLWEGRLPHSVREMSRSDRGRPPPSAGGTRKARDGGREEISACFSPPVKCCAFDSLALSRYPILFTAWSAVQNRPLRPQMFPFSATGGGHICCPSEGAETAGDS